MPPQSRVVRSGMKFAKSLEIPHGGDFAMAMYFMVVFVLFFFTHPESNFYPYRVPGGIPAGSRRGPARPRLVVCAPQLVAVTLCTRLHSRNALHASIERVASFPPIVRYSLNSSGSLIYGKSRDPPRVLPWRIRPTGHRRATHVASRLR